MKILSKLTILCFCALFVSCVPSLHPLSSEPPAKSIRVNKPFSVGDGFLVTKLNLPEGIYKPLYEDKNGYYYQAPQRITGRDSFLPLLIEGGLYFEKNRVKPEKIYGVANNYGIPTKFLAKDKGDYTLLK